jgi:glyoxylate reductase
MKDDVVIVNTARGAVIDEAALVEALDSGKVYSAGLDVFEEEPEIHPGLVRNPNVLLVPHMGTYTVEVCAAGFCVSFFSFASIDLYTYNKLIANHDYAR